MKVIIGPIFRFMFATILIIIVLIIHVGINITEIFWEFKIVKWREHLNNDCSFYRDEYKCDVSIIETFKRYYNLNIY